MKRYIKTIGFLFLSLLALSACQVGFIPEGIKEQVPLESVQEAKWLRESMYSTLRSAESPSNLFLGDMQADLYHLTISDGNTYYPFYSWNEANLNSNDMIAGYFGAYATIIKDANYVIMRVNELKENKKLAEPLTDDEKATLDIYVAEARALRALANYRLMTRFSKCYNEANNGGDPGIILMKEYDPLLEKTSKTRATQKEVYDYCLTELEEAAQVIPDKSTYMGRGELSQDGIPCYLVKDFCYAVRARILLEMHRYEDAVKEVDRFVDNYTLTDGTADGLKKLWITEDSPEIMIKTFATNKVGRVYGILHGLFIYDQVHPNTGDPQRFEPTSPTWFPSQYLIDLYKKSEGTGDPALVANQDNRIALWLEDTGDGHAHYDGFPVIYWETIENEKITFISKFRGNPRLDTDPAKHRYSYAHSTHLFDIAEAYLIKAEAQAWGGDMDGAKATLETLRKSRGIEESISATTLEEVKQLVKDERTRELVGMGTRMTDLKRWGDPMDRTNKPLQEGLTKGQAATTVTKSFLDLKKPAGDKMFYWEFPLQDRFANKELEKNW